LATGNIFSYIPLQILKCLAWINNLLYANPGIEYCNIILYYCVLPVAISLSIRSASTAREWKYRNRIILCKATRVRIQHVTILTRCYSFDRRTYIEDHVLLYKPITRCARALASSYVCYNNAEYSEDYYIKYHQQREIFTGTERHSILYESEKRWRQTENRNFTVFPTTLHPYFRLYTFTWMRV